jgi:hypothetical protein
MRKKKLQLNYRKIFFCFINKLLMIRLCCNIEFNPNKLIDEKFKYRESIYNILISIMTSDLFIENLTNYVRLNVTLFRSWFGLEYSSTFFLFLRCYFCKKV